MTLAEFKRSIRPGDIVTMTANTRVPNLPFIGKRRRVSRITSRYLVLIFEQPGDVFDFHTPLPKARDFECDGKSFTFTRRSVTAEPTYWITYRWERKLVEIPHRSIQRLGRSGPLDDVSKSLHTRAISGQNHRRFTGSRPCESIADESGTLDIAPEIGSANCNALPCQLDTAPHLADLRMALGNSHHDESRPLRCFSIGPHAGGECRQSFENVASSHRSDYGSKHHRLALPALSWRS